MNTDEIIRMAREAGAGNRYGVEWVFFGDEMLERLAQLVEDAAFKRWAAQTKLAVEDEREACCSPEITNNANILASDPPNIVIEKYRLSINKRGQQ